MEYVKLISAIHRYMETKDQRAGDLDLHIEVNNGLELALREYVDVRIERALRRRDGMVAL